METVVRLDTDGLDVTALVGKLTDFLLTREIITANLERDELEQPSAWRAAPRWLSVLEPHAEIWRSLVNNGVDVVVERQLYHPYENYELTGSFLSELRTVMGGRTQIVRAKY